MPDPAKVEGDESAINAAFDITLAVLRGGISALVKQLQAQPHMDTVRLQIVLDDIAVDVRMDPRS